MIAKPVVPARAWRLLVVLVVLCSALGVGAQSANAWPGNDKNLCEHSFHRDQVTAINPVSFRDARGQVGDWTIRACSPDLRLPGSAIATPTEMFKEVLPQHVLQGGGRAPHISRGRLRLFPYLMGPEGQAVRYQGLLGSEILLRAIAGAGIEGGTVLTIGVISCLAGGFATGGIACAGIPAAAVAGIVGAITGVIEGLIENQLDRVITMASSAWDFYAPPGWKGWIVWNGFGTIGHNYIDPSFTNLWPAETPPFRIWAWFSAFGMEQGKNPDLGGSGASDSAMSAARRDPISGVDVNPNNLRTSHGEIVKRGPDRVVEIRAPGRRIQFKQGDNVIVGKGAREDLIAGSGDDVLLVRGPRSRIWSGRGEDVLVATGRGDRLYAGPGYDELLAAGHGDWLYSGRGSDTMVSERGTATVIAGRNSRVDVLNRRPTDTVICPQVNRDIVIADRGDRVSRSCRFVFVDGKGAPASPAMVGSPNFTGAHDGTRVIGP
jgi:hypothetical protein